MIRPLALTLLLATSTSVWQPGPVRAQTTVEDQVYASLREAALRRDTVRVTLTNGTALEGTVERMEADQFVIRVKKGQERVIRREQLAQVRPAPKDRQRLVLLGVAVGTFLLVRSFWNWLHSG